TRNPAGTCRPQARRSDPADRSAAESAAAAAISAIGVIPRATTPPPARDTVRMVARLRPRPAVDNRDRGFALGRSLDARADPIAGRAGRERAAVAPVHGAARVPSAMAAAGAPF